jgi:hypothetical protein
MKVGESRGKKLKGREKDEAMGTEEAKEIEG